MLGIPSGIGRATAIALSAAGWKLSLAARRNDELLETRELCTGDKPCLVVGDITDEAYVTRLFEETLRVFGTVPSHQAHLHQNPDAPFECPLRSA